MEPTPQPTPQELEILAEFRRRQDRTAMADRCRASLYEFVIASWHVLEPATPLVLNWHVKVLCDAVQAVLEDWADLRTGKIDAYRIQNLLINIPPGTLKSRVTTVAGPCWMWLRCPEWRVIAFSGNEAVTVRDSVYRRDLIESDWYQQTFKPEWKLKEDQNAKLAFNNDRGGFMQAMTAGQRITGNRADTLLVDDPNDAQTVGSDDIRNKINLVWWDQGAANRVNDPRGCCRIGIMQRLHEDDWAGHVLAQRVKGVPVWWHLNLPQEYEVTSEEHPCTCGRADCVLPIGRLDPRTEPGELLFPARFTIEVLAQELETLTETGYAGQHQQRPYPKGGGLIKKEWFQFYLEDPRDMKFDYSFQTWDLAFKKTKTSDFVCGQVWGIKGVRRYLLAQYHKRADFPETVAAIRSMTKQWPKAVAKYVEDKANGSAVISSLRQEIEGIIPVTPEGGKEARVNAVAPLIESGCVYLPTKIRCPWVDGLLAECEAFPNGLHDDRVDAMSQGLVKTIGRRHEQPKDERTEEERVWDSVEQYDKDEAEYKHLLEKGFDQATAEEWSFGVPGSGAV